jgi:hypothetical protein
MKITHFVSVFVILAFLSACAGAGSSLPTATPVDIGALQTVAVQTVIAGITQTAAAQPSPLPSETSTPVPPAATETATPSPSPTAPLCDNSAFISDASVTDHTQMAAGQPFIKSWKVKNTGTCAWGIGYQIRWSHGEKMGGQSTALTAAVQPGAEVEISINLKAPDKTGSYGGYWRLFNNNGYAFGEVFSVIISVP